MIDVEKLVLSRRFPEALYFGALQMTKKADARTHLYLGLACCGMIKPLAQLVRHMYKLETDVPPPCVVVGRHTSMVYEGLHHLFEATELEPDIKLPPALGNMVLDVLDDLNVYLAQEFHDMPRGQKYHFANAATAAALLLSRLAGLESALPSQLQKAKDRGQAVLDSLATSPERDASFYAFRSL